MTTATAPRTQGQALLPQVLEFIRLRRGLGFQLFAVNPETGLVSSEFDKLRIAAAELGANTEQTNSLLIAWVRAGRPTV